MSHSPLTAWKVRGAQPKEFGTSIDYDARIFDYRAKDETVSLATFPDGRIHVPLILGDYQRCLDGEEANCCRCGSGPETLGRSTSLSKTKMRLPRWTAHGRSLGDPKYLPSYHGTLHSGSGRQKFKNGRNKSFAHPFQFQKTTAVPARYCADCLNAPLHYVVEPQSQQGHRSEARHAIRDDSDGTAQGYSAAVQNPQQHTTDDIWLVNFGQLQTFVAYKAARCGIKIEYVDPAYPNSTSPMRSAWQAQGRRVLAVLPVALRTPIFKRL